MTQPRISFEFFPPKSISAAFQLSECLQTLTPLDPAFVSVTYGAGGTSHKQTHETAQLLHQQKSLNVAAHLTCVNASTAETRAVAHGYAGAGITQIVALRGDPPQRKARFHPHPDGYASSVALIEDLAKMAQFHIHVAAYPEPHPEATDMQAGIAYLKRKIAAGATSAITQFFFEAETFLRFRDACEKAGVDIPIIPGILPIANWNRTVSLANYCGASIPQVVADAFRNVRDDQQATLLATAIATETCDQLINEGVENLHFYTLNRAYLTQSICTALGYRACEKLRSVA